MNDVVKFTRLDDGSYVDGDIRHLAWCTSDPCILCTGEFYGEGQSKVEYICKKGKITCNQCINIIKEIKKVRL